MSPDVDVLVVGGGLAGCAVATILARSGRDVRLLERGSFPRDKLCGEFLSAESQDVLRKMDVFRRIESVRPPRIGRARFIGPSGRTVHIQLPEPAFGISRKRLDAELFDAATAAGADAHVRAEVTEIHRIDGGHEVEVRGQSGAKTQIRARTVVCAHGRRGRPDHALSRAFLTQGHPHIGLKRHHRPTNDARGAALSEALADHVEIYPFEGGYCGMSFVETGEVNVCLLAHERVLRAANRGWDAVVSAIADQHRPLAERLSALTPTDAQALAVAAVPFTPKTRLENGVFFVGDAAGMIAPLAGDGQAMALESGCRLGALLLEGREAAAMLWDKRWRRAYGVRMALAGGLQKLLLQSRSAEWALWGVGAVPGLPNLLGRLTRG